MIRVYTIRAEGERLADQRKAAERLLCAVLAKKYGEAAAHLQIARTEAGKPYFPTAPEICFNISHAGSYAVLAIGDEPVGVDIERIRPLHSRIAERYLGDGTLSGSAAIAAWTKRESYGKFTGEGFFASEPRKPHIFTELPAPDGYLLCVCSASGKVEAAEL